MFFICVLSWSIAFHSVGAEHRITCGSGETQITGLGGGGHWWLGSVPLVSAVYLTVSQSSHLVTLDGLHGMLMQNEARGPPVQRF